MKKKNKREIFDDAAKAITLGRNAVTHLQNIVAIRFDGCGACSVCDAQKWLLKNGFSREDITAPRSSREIP